MLFAIRPLFFTELVEIACISVDDNDRIEIDDSAISIKQILKICGNFIVEDESGLAHFAHVSVREYFNNRLLHNIHVLEFSSTLCHLEIAKSCLGYLLKTPASEIKEIIKHERGKFVDDIKTYFFLCWAIHWGKVSTDQKRTGSLGKLYFRFLSKNLAESHIVEWVAGMATIFAPHNPFIPAFIPLNSLIRSISRVYGPDMLLYGSCYDTKFGLGFLLLCAACIWGFTELTSDSYLSKKTLHVMSVKHSRAVALTMAYRWGHYDIVEQLIRDGAPVISQNGGILGVEEISPLLRVNPILSDKDNKIFTLLVSKMRPREFRLTWHEQTLLQKTCEQGETERVRILLKHMDTSSILQRCGKNLDTALHAAVRANKKDIVQLLVDKLDPKRVNTQNRDGETPLHVSALVADTEIMFLLFEKSDTRHKNSWGETVLHIAAQRGHKKQVQLLLTKMDLKSVAAEAKLPSRAQNEETVVTQTALDQAKEHNEEEVVQIIQQFISQHTKAGGLDFLKSLAVRD